MTGPSPVDGRCVLVVDDSASVRGSVSATLEHAGARTVTAADGAEGWRSLNAHRVAVILTDLMMPVMDGLKLIALVRGTPGPHQRTPIVVITAEGTDDDRARAMSLGANAYLEKPVDGEELLEVLKGILG